MFHETYTRHVLQPAYTHWRDHYSQALLRVHRAHLVMLQEQGLLPPGTAAKLKTGLEALERELVAPEAIPADVEDLYFLQEAWLTERLGSQAGYLHLARSRNDMDTTVFRLVLKDRLLTSLAAVERLCASLLRGSERTELFLLSTHGQPANVSTLGHYLSAFLLEVLDDAEELAAALALVDRSTMGACAITTTGFAIHRDRVSSLLGFRAPVTNAYQAIASSHWLVRPASAVRHLAGDLTRLVADLGPRASGENGTLHFPDSLVQSSSIMPQKRNPVILEHIRIQAGLASGVSGGLEDLFRNLAFQDVNEVADEPVTAFLGALDHLDAAMELLQVVVDHVRVDQARVRQITLQLGVTSTELADRLVREHGLSFRDAHSVVKAFVQAGHDPGALRKAFADLGNGPLGEDDAWIAQTLEPQTFVAVRQVPGGPSPEGMRSVTDEARARLERLGQRHGAWTDTLRQASAALDTAFGALA